MMLSKTPDGSMVVTFEPGEISYAPNSGHGLAAVKFSQGMGDFLRNLPDEERTACGHAIGAAFTQAIMSATTRLVRASEGTSVTLPGVRKIRD